MTKIRIATWNVNSLKVRLPRLLEWLEFGEPDVLCLQETKMTDEVFSGTEYQAEIQKLGYETAHYGQGGYNGVAILSRIGLKNVQRGFSIPEENSKVADPKGKEADTEKGIDPDARMIWADCKDMRVGSAYIPNGRELGHAHYFYKLEWFSWLKKQVTQELETKKQVVVVGDFNVAPTNLDVWDPKAFEGATHTSPKERQAWESVLEAGLVDVFREQYPEVANLYTYWDYQHLRFPKHQGIRIDHILASQPLAKNLKWVVVDRNARKGEKPSDHSPVMAEFG